MTYTIDDLPMGGCRNWRTHQAHLDAGTGLCENQHPTRRISRLERVRAYLLGASEFRLGVTTSFEDYTLLCAYDAGRERAHRITRRRWDEAS